MNPADAAQCEALRLGELKEHMGNIKTVLHTYAFLEQTRGNQEVASQIEQASMKCEAAIQTINFKLRSL